jgi:hypothetical protein
LFSMVFALTSVAAEGATDPLDGTWKITSGKVTFEGEIWDTFRSAEVPYVKIAVVEQGSGGYRITLNGGDQVEGESIISDSWNWLYASRLSYQRVASGEYRLHTTSTGDNGVAQWEMVFKVNGSQLQYTQNVSFPNGVRTMSVTLQREYVEPNHPSMLVPAAPRVNLGTDEKKAVNVTLPAAPEGTVVLTSWRWIIWYIGPDKTKVTSKALLHKLDDNHGGDANGGTAESEGGGEGGNYEAPVELNPEKSTELSVDFSEGLMTELIDRFEEGSDYVWQVRLKYEQAGQTGWTQWSKETPFSVGEVTSGGNDSGGGGGCDLGLGFFAAGFAAVLLAYLNKKRRSAE